VVDLGVNNGAFALVMIERFGCHVIGVEPVPDLFAALPCHPLLSVRQVAITPDGEPAQLYLNRAGDAATIDRRLTDPAGARVTVAGVTLAALLDQHAIDRVALVKVDIEGAEIELFRNATPSALQRIDQFTVEFHDFLDPSLRDEVHEVRRVLRSAGFAELQLSRDSTDVLFVNAARIRFGVAQRAAATAFYKYPRGLRRQLARRLGSAQLRAEQLG
jgi:FkbM family methyltransferase